MSILSEQLSGRTQSATANDALHSQFSFAHASWPNPCFRYGQLSEHMPAVRRACFRDRRSYFRFRTLLTSA